MTNLGQKFVDQWGSVQGVKTQTFPISFTTDHIIVQLTGFELGDTNIQVLATLIGTNTDHSADVIYCRKAVTPANPYCVFTVLGY